MSHHPPRVKDKWSENEVIPFSSLVKRRFLILTGNKNPKGHDWAQVRFVARGETTADQAFSTDARV